MSTEDPIVSRVKVTLRALGFTPRTLSQALNISEKVARRILRDDGTLYSSDYFAITQLFATDMPNLLTYGVEEAVQRMVKRREETVA